MTHNYLTKYSDQDAGSVSRFDHMMAVMESTNQLVSMLNQLYYPKDAVWGLLGPTCSLSCWELLMIRTVISCGGYSGTIG